ncbi:MAG: hypothetical protein GWP63_10570, partial [Haliea sp.]|nr:hypothetical protein [Haliea sp.]
FVGDYGMQRVMAPDPGEQREGDRRRYHAVDGNMDLRVEIVDQSCTDSMKGDSFPSRVSVRLNGEEFQGCGRDLDYPW